MKKIAIIFTGLLIGAILFGQTQGQAVEGDLRVTGDLSSTNTDVVASSTSVNSSSITTLETNTIGTINVKGLTFDGDTMFVNDGISTRWFLQGGSEDVDNTPPTVLSAEVGAIHDSVIYVYMSEPVDSLVASVAWGVLEGEFEMGVDTMDFLDATTMRVLLDSAAASNAIINLRYTRPGNSGDIQDTAGNYLISFLGQSVTNNVACSAITEESMWLVNNDGSDEAGNNVIVATGGATYTSSTPLEGVASGDLNATDRHFAVPSIAYGNSITISGWFRIYTGIDTRVLYTTLQSDNGFEISYNFTSDRLEAETGNGSSTVTALSSSSLGYRTGEWEHWAVVFNRSSSICNIYWNGVDVTSTATTRSDYETTSIARIGLAFDDTNDMFGDMDDNRVYKAQLTASDIDSVYSNPGVTISTSGCGDPPVPDEDVVELWSHDWESYAIQTTLRSDTFALYMDNFESAQSTGGTGIYDYADIVSFDGQQWAKSWYRQGQCCTASDNQAIANGGTGFNPAAYITGVNDFYKEVYFSYEMQIDAVSGDFVNSDGFKIPGLLSQKGGSYTDAMALGMILDTDLGSNLDPAYFTHAWWSSEGFDGTNVTRSNTKTGETWIQSGVTVVVTIRCVYGTSGDSNGFMEFFFDGIFIGGQGLGSWRPGDGLYSIPFYKPGVTNEHSTPVTGWSYINISTFMGGDIVSYQSSKDQFLLLGKLSVWKYSDTAEGVPRWDDDQPRSGPLRDITGALRTLGFDL